MCCCAKPNKNGEPGYSWDGKNVGTRPANGPALHDGETMLFDEPGRCKPMINGKGSIDYHSHHFRLVGSRHGHLRLLVSHGGGEERIPLGYSSRIADLIALLPDSDSRYLMLHALYSAYSDGDRAGYERTSKRYEDAFVSGELKKRKVRGTSGYRVFFKLRIADLMGAK